MVHRKTIESIDFSGKTVADGGGGGCGGDDNDSKQQTQTQTIDDEEVKSVSTTGSTKANKKKEKFKKFTNRLDNRVAGKFKRGGQRMEPNSVLCVVNCSDGSRHAILSSAHVKLIEINEQLITQPNLLTEEVK